MMYVWGSAVLLGIISAVVWFYIFNADKTSQATIELCHKVFNTFAIMFFVTPFLYMIRTSLPDFKADEPNSILGNIVLYLWLCTSTMALSIAFALGSGIDTSTSSSSNNPFTKDEYDTKTANFMLAKDHLKWLKEQSEKEKK